ncbi:hypothetical protein VNO77_41164 [Canavalia gladiata]|uniref:Uncharacterized protein n=1 Tax=Canavalia gladiata TaxID=3824 RepID=A0AAN9PQ01_CANGL
MTSFSLLVLLVLSVSLHACTARSLSLAKKDTANYPFHKKLDMVKTLTASSVKDSKLEENQPPQQKEANNEINTCKRGSGVSTSKKMIVGASSGISFQSDSPSFLAAKDERRHARSMLGPVEETVVTNASDTAEDIVEMDYAQPHRKPPIHNEKP